MAICNILRPFGIVLDQEKSGDPAFDNLGKKHLTRWLLEMPRKVNTVLPQTVGT
jgi:hypothetical protein